MIMTIFVQAIIGVIGRGESYKDDCIMQFLARPKNGGHWHLGNSIGNLRVWESSKNRSDGDAAPSIKLNIDNNKELDSFETLLQQSAIDPSQIDDWRICSGDEPNRRSWNENRVQAFQRVVEKRAFTLYIRFYTDLVFSAWPEKFLMADSRL
jgi:hypothetical protein